MKEHTHVHRNQGFFSRGSASRDHAGGGRGGEGVNAEPPAPPKLLDSLHGRVASYSVSLQLTGCPTTSRCHAPATHAYDTMLAASDHTSPWTLGIDIAVPNKRWNRASAHQIYRLLAHTGMIGRPTAGLESEWGGSLNAPWINLEVKTRRGPVDISLRVDTYQPTGFHESLRRIRRLETRHTYAAATTAVLLDFHLGRFDHASDSEQCGGARGG